MMSQVEPCSGSFHSLSFPWIFSVYPEQCISLTGALFESRERGQLPPKVRTSVLRVFLYQTSKNFLWVFIELWLCFTRENFLRLWSWKNILSFIPDSGTFLPLYGSLPRISIKYPVNLHVKLTYTPFLPETPCIFQYIYVTHPPVHLLKKYLAVHSINLPPSR